MCLPNIGPELLEIFLSWIEGFPTPALNSSVISSSSVSLSGLVSTSPPHPSLPVAAERRGHTSAHSLIALHGKTHHAAASAAVLFKTDVGHVAVDHQANVVWTGGCRSSQSISQGLDPVTRVFDRHCGTVVLLLAGISWSSLLEPNCLWREVCFFLQFHSTSSGTV